MPAHPRRGARQRGRAGSPESEGVVDPPVGRVGLPVDTVRVNLQQDRDAVPSITSTATRARGTGQIAMQMTSGMTVKRSE